MFIPRKWQVRAINQCADLFEGGFERALIFACPGSGKTYGALLVAQRLMKSSPIANKVVVLTPNLAIKSQWIDRSKEMGLNLIAINDAEVLLAGIDDMFSGGFILTYQQAINMRASLRLFCDTHRPIAILDEVHHTCGPMGHRDGNVWGTTVSYSLDNASFKLCTTGTPFREGPNPIAFVKYTDDTRVAHAHVEYGYEEAIRDRVCRPIQFEVYDGEMEWSDSKGISTQADFGSKLTKIKSKERLRAAVSMDGRFPIKMLSDANDRLIAIRQEPGAASRAAGMVLAMDISHAENIAEELSIIAGVRPVIVHNKIDDSLEKINSFRDSDLPWIIGIQMLSEGVDIPRLRVGVYCTNIRATLYFHQFCGRMTRVQSGDIERAYVFMPADPELEATAKSIEKEVAHALGEEVPFREPTGARGRRGDGPGIMVEDSDGELHSSLFSGRSISADYLRKHEGIIREYADMSPSFRNLSQVEIAMMLVKAKVLPSFDEVIA